MPSVIRGDDNFDSQSTVQGTFSSSVSLSGQTTSITGIPSGVSYVEVHLWDANNVQADTGLRLGTSSGYSTTYKAQGGQYKYRNYAGGWREVDQTAIWAYDNIATAYWGFYQCTKILNTNHYWHVQAHMCDTDGIFYNQGAVDLGASLDRVQVTNPSWGSHSAGTMQLRYR